MVNTTSAEFTTDVPTNFGSILQKARIAAGFSVADVAAKLHYHTKYIEDIESDTLTRLPQSLIFKRGYIRNYARLLKLSEAQIQQFLSREDLNEAPVVTKVVARAHPQLSVRDKRIRWITYGIVLVLVILLIMWWHAQVTEHHETAVRLPDLNATTETSHSASKTVMPSPPASTAVKTEMTPVEKKLASQATASTQEPVMLKSITNEEPPKEVTENASSHVKKTMKKPEEVVKNLNFDSN